jgi:hypothetical protein
MSRAGSSPWPEYSLGIRTQPRYMPGAFSMGKASREGQRKDAAHRSRGGFGSWRGVHPGTQRDRCGGAQEKAQPLPTAPG